MLEPTDNGILLEIEGLRTAKAALKTWEGRISAYENSIKSIIGDCAGMKGEWGKLTWQKNKDSQKIDWKAAFDELALQYDPEAIRQCLSHHTLTKPGARVFRSFFTKED